MNNYEFNNINKKIMQNEFKEVLKLMSVSGTTLLNVYKENDEVFLVTNCNVINLSEFNLNENLKQIRATKVQLVDRFLKANSNALFKNTEQAILRLDKYSHDLVNGREIFDNNLTRSIYEVKYENEDSYPAATFDLNMELDKLIKSDIMNVTDETKKDLDKYYENISKFKESLDNENLIDTESLGEDAEMFAKTINDFKASMGNDSESSNTNDSNSANSNSSDGSDNTL